MTQNQKEIVGVHGLVNSSATHHSRLPRIVLLFLVLCLYNSFSFPPFSFFPFSLLHLTIFSFSHLFPFLFFLSLVASLFPSIASNTPLACFYFASSSALLCFSCLLFLSSFLVLINLVPTLLSFP